MKNIYIQLLEAFKEHVPFALATIVQTKGSTPQIPGASALFSSEGLIAGTLGGGILEADAEKRAMRSLEKRASCIYEFNLTGDIISTDEAICGGEVTILVDAHPEKHMNTVLSMRQSLEKRQSGVMATFIGKNAGGNVSVSRQWIDKTEHMATGTALPYDLSQNQLSKILSTSTPCFQALNSGRSNEHAEEAWTFLEPIQPLPQLIIAGAGHVGQAVSHLGRLLNFEVTVIDDRSEYANSKSCPDADHIIVKDIGKAIKDAPIASDTYIVIVTRGHNKDAETLRSCIDSEAAYIGMIGSTRKTALMRTKFLEEGWATPSQFDCVYAPIGIDIQSKTVQEITISIAAQLVQVRRMKQKHEREVPWSGP